MSFVSLEFLLFFPLVTLIYFSLQNDWQKIWLLLTSYFFYMYWNPLYLGLILFSTVVDYTAARAIADAPSPARRKQWLAFSLVTNLTTLFLFKYFFFFNVNAARIFRLFDIPYEFEGLDLLLPVGISFYTFQSISYTIDVYRGKLKPEKQFIHFATYISFFPQLVAGPIERAGNMLPQFRDAHTFDYGRAVEGLRRILWGVFKKIVVADRLAIYVNVVYGQPRDYDGAVLAVATVFFAFQIYCDFSAYSDIAIGTAKILGFDLMENFRQPYLATSFRDFWQRWHISLSTWFRDYVYIPLGGNRVTLPRLYANLMIVFLLSGLWHGAGWLFVAWGGLHGFFLIAERMLEGALGKSSWKLPIVVRGVIVFVLVTVAWIFFRATTIGDAFYILSHLPQVSLQESVLEPLRQANIAEEYIQLEMALSVMSIVALMCAEWLLQSANLDQKILQMPRAVRFAGYYAVLLLVLFVGVPATQQFIYFQF